jgi:hypothetical protein
MANSAYFSDSYTEAREKFLSAAKISNAHVISQPYPQKGPPSDEDLFFDIARIGDHNAERVLVIVSGTHGVEGFCGSAIQTAWLRSSSLQLAPRTSVYLLHALNPYGFAWRRRVNEDNVDLNRNFVESYTGDLTHNAEYRELEPLLNPRVLDGRSMGCLDPALKEWFGSEDKKRAFKAAVGKGQYEFPEGIIFGGKAPTWSNAQLRQFISSLPIPLDIGVVLDIHTGLGESGQLEVFTEESGNKLVLLRKWFPGVKLTSLGDPISLGYPIAGSLYQAFTEANTNSPWHCVALEFGTKSLVDVLLALQADNWLHCFAGQNHPLANRVREDMTNTFSVSADQCRQQVLGAALNVIDKAFAGIAAYR